MEGRITTKTNKNNNFNNRFWIVFTVTMTTGIIAREFLHSKGGIKTFPFAIQIAIVLFFPILYFLIVKHEKCKVNIVRYNLMKVMGWFITILALLVSLMITIANFFKQYWLFYKDIFAVIVPAFFLIFAVIMLILTVKNLDEIKRN